MTFRLRIETDNEAFAGTAGIELARILNRLAIRVADWPGCNDFSVKLHDINGNTVGEASADDESATTLKEG